ncbi:MAG: major facilitator superfamily domain-containing protein [Piptocephalis tieghemiana]|nr:MAG: major facilitator superfamily domain-containing protein [Piptocephalis tieghemiana]
MRDRTLEEEPLLDTSLDQQRRYDVENSPHSTERSTSEDTQASSESNESNYPWQYRAIALACALLLSVGSHYAAHTLGTLKAIVKEDLGISNAQYGVLQSSVSVVNTILPILGGLFVDVFGTSLGSVLATTFIAGGNILVALSVSVKSFPIMVVGRVLYGLGSGSIVIVQGTILTHWFKGGGLSWAMGLQIAVSRLASYLSMATVVPIMRWTGWYGYAFWFSAGLCVLSLLITIVYTILMRMVRRETTERDRKILAKKKSFHPVQVLSFPLSYWWILAFSFTVAASWTTFLHINSEMIKLKYGGTNEGAARVASLAQVLPIFVAPFMGWWHEKYGRRSLILGIASVTFIISMALLLFTQVPPTIPMLIFSFSLTIGPVALTSGIPLLLRKLVVGTGLGLNKSVQNVAVTIFDIVNGLLQDQGHGSYDRVLIMYLVLGIIGVATSFAMSLYDTRGHLDGTQNSDDSEDEEEEEEEEGGHWWSWMGIILCVASLFTSWILFFRHLL